MGVEADKIRPHMGLDDAINIVRQSGMYRWGTGPDEDWTRLKSYLANPITPDNARLLQEALLIWTHRYYPDLSVRDIVDWLEAQPLSREEFEDRYEEKRLQACLAGIARGDLPWSDFIWLRGKRRDQARQAFIDRGYFPWHSVEINRQLEVSKVATEGDGPRLAPNNSDQDGTYPDVSTAMPCPKCATSPTELEWVYHYEPPPHSPRSILFGLAMLVLIAGMAAWFFPYWVAALILIAGVAAWLFNRHYNPAGAKHRGWLTICNRCRLQVDFFHAWMGQR